MDKEEFREKMNLEDKTMVNLHPELNQSGYYDNEGNIIPGEDREGFAYMPVGFINSGLIFYLLGKKDIKLYLFIASKANRWRNTRMTNRYICESTGIKNATINRALRRLEFYHFISRRIFYIKPKVRRRIITLLKWETAYKRLVKEGRIKAVSSNDIVLVEPYKNK